METQFKDEPSKVENASVSDLDKREDVSEQRENLVKAWLKRVKASEEHFAPVFARMRRCQQLASEGAEDEWVKNEKFTVPIITRYINQSVASLYAKNPKASATRKKKLMFTVWDGRQDSLEAAMQSIAMPQIDPLTGAPMIDPNAGAILQEVQAAVEYNQMVDKVAKTLTALFAYFTEEQATNFKMQVKALIRRTKINAAAWIKLGFQRELQPNPEAESRIDDATNQMAQLELLLAKTEDPETSDTAAELEAVRLLIQQMRAEPEIVVREGPVFAFPRSEEIIVDKNCTHLKTLTGAGWLAHKMHKNCDDVKKIYGVDIKGKYKAHKRAGETEDKVCVYEVQDRDSGQVFTLADGYNDFLREPGAPDVRIERFFTLFPLVFNETEGGEKHLYPNSDVWNLRHLQEEYNRSREALREHRKAARPNYAGARGKLSKEDKNKLAGGCAHEYIEIEGMQPGDKIGDILQQVPKAPIDPNLYQVEELFSDMLRSTGAQEANLGALSGGTATESSIAEQSRSASLAENIDDLDEFLSDFTRATGQLLLLEMSAEIVKDIAGPGAAWPDAAQSRAAIAKDLMLDIKAGSSGRPNAAAKLANMERAMPFIIQIPGVNPAPIARQYLDLLEIDVEEAMAEGLPSLTAFNAMMAKTAVPAASNDPAQQGGQGGDNTATQAGSTPPPQPEYPAPNGLAPTG